MKKWEKPELGTLKINSTKTTGDCTCGAAHGILVISNNTHFCHSLGEWHENGCKKTEGHDRSAKCDQHWSTAHDSKCCCAGKTDIPGQS